MKQLQDLVCECECTHRVAQSWFSSWQSTSSSNAKSRSKVKKFRTLLMKSITFLHSAFENIWKLRGNNESLKLDYITIEVKKKTDIFRYINFKVQQRQKRNFVLKIIRILISNDLCMKKTILEIGFFKFCKENAFV